MRFWKKRTHLSNEEHICKPECLKTHTYLQGSKLMNTLPSEKRGHLSKDTDTSTSLNIAFSLAVTQIQRNYEHHTTNVGKGRAINLLFV